MVHSKGASEESETFSTDRSTNQQSNSNSASFRSASSGAIQRRPSRKRIDKEDIYSSSDTESNRRRSVRMNTSRTQEADHTGYLYSRRSKRPSRSQCYNYDLYTSSDTENDRSAQSRNLKKVDRSRYSYERRYIDNQKDTHINLPDSQKLSASSDDEIRTSPKNIPRTKNAIARNENKPRSFNGCAENGHPDRSTRGRECSDIPLGQIINRPRQRRVVSYYEAPEEPLTRRSRRFVPPPERETREERARARLARFEPVFELHPETTSNPDMNQNCTQLNSRNVLSTISRSSLDSNVPKILDIKERPGRMNNKSDSATKQSKSTGRTTETSLNNDSRTRKRSRKQSSDSFQNNFDEEDSIVKTNVKTKGNKTKRTSTSLSSFEDDSEDEEYVVTRKPRRSAGISESNSPKRYRPSFSETEESSLTENSFDYDSET